jgi:hypothetical protein
MAMSDADVALVLHTATQQTARKLGVDNVEWKSMEELRPFINEKNPEIAQALERFSTAYLQ